MLTTSIQAVGEGNYGRLGATQQGRYLEVQATLRSVNFGGEPVLSDLTVLTNNHPKTRHRAI